MANPLIPPLVSNTPPPIDFNESNEIDDDFGGFETSDVTFNNNFIDDTPSLPSTPRDVSKTPDSISELDLPVVPSDHDIDPVTSTKSINVTDLDNSHILFDKTKTICDKPLENNNNYYKDRNYYQPEIIKSSDKLEIKIIDDYDITGHYLGCVNYNEDEHDDSNNFKLDENPPSLMLSSNDLEDLNEFNNAFDTNNINSSPNINQISKNNRIHITNCDDDGSVLSLKLDPVRISTGNSPMLHVSKFKHEKDDIDVENDFHTFQDSDKLNKDNCFLETVNKLQDFKDHLSSNFPNELEITFETHFEANFNDAEFFLSTSEVDEQFIPVQTLDTKSHLSDINDDDFGDFNDFTVELPVNVVENNNLNAESKNVTKNETSDRKIDISIKASNINDDNDDFSNISDFTLSQAVPETIVFQKPILELQQLNSVLDYMFPLQQNYDGNIQIDIKNHDRFEQNSPLVNLLDFDTTIALKFQWNNSSSNQVLVKSLGIDSRNILFGSKWNISVPRFAANLGFCPLEPLKQTATSTTSNLYGANNNVPSNKIQSVIGTDVPAAQFDWNSAGLINPLDASQAHTLLLDLEQLVAVANLDKIKLDSSSSCSSAFPVILSTTSTTTITTATTTTSKSTTKLLIASNSKPITITKTKFNHNNNNINVLSSNCDDGGVKNNFHNDIIVDFIKNGDGQIYQNYNSFINSALTTNQSINIESKNDQVNKRNFDLFGVYWNYSQKETVRETSHSENQLISTENNSVTNYLPTVPPSIIVSPSTINPSIVSSPVLSPLEESLSIKTDLEVQIEHNNDFSGVINSYVPSSSGNLRETHIFTPSKGINPISRDVSCINATTLELTNIVNEFEELSSEIKINKNVITKEYRDVEYEFPGANDILQPIIVNNTTTCNSSTDIIINWPDPGNYATSVSYENGVPSKCNNDEFEFTEFQGTNTIKYDPRDDDIEYDAELNKHNYENSNNDNKKCPILSSPIHTPQVTNNEVFLKPTIGLSPTEELKTTNSNKDFDDEFTEFQYVSPPPPLHFSSLTNKGSQSTVMPNTMPIPREIDNSVLPNCNNFYEQSSINTLAPINLHNPNKVHRQHINAVWADPSGIDSDEIARIEAAFSYNNLTVMRDENKIVVQTNNKDDDEWSDFVSSTTVATNKPTNTINMATFTCSNTVTVGVDDDWSEFVSGIPPDPIISNNSLSHHTVNSRPNFLSWNSPIQYNSYKKITSPPSIAQLPQSPHNQNFYKTQNNGLILNPMLNHNHQMSNGISLLDSGKSHNITNSSTSNRNNTKLQQQPNISLIPDLGFIAPKNLINASRTNFNINK